MLLSPISNTACRFRKISGRSSLHNIRLFVSRVTIADSFQPCYCKILKSKRFISHGDHTKKEVRERGARPLYFQQSPRAVPPPNYNHAASTTTKATKDPNTQTALPITPYEFSGTASVLPPHAWHLSPCLGAALSISPLAGNLMRLGQRQPHSLETGRANDESTVCDSANTTDTDRHWSELLSRVGFLANNLFFQMIRESPIHMGRNKSMPAVYLTPGLIGCLLAHHQTSTSSPKKLPKKNRTNRRGRGSSRSNGNRSFKKDPNSTIKEALKRDFGIRSNHIYGSQWTGISLARWMDLVIPNEHISSSISSNNDDVTIEVFQQSMVSALWLIALWGVTPSRESLLDYYDAVERSGIACDLDTLRRNDQHASFTADDFAPKEMEAAMNRLLEHYSSDEGDARRKTDDAAATARAFELVCAAIVLQQQERQTPTSIHSLRPAVPNGYFAFDGGGTNADCAEVAVREILSLLLWDNALGRMDTSRLPATASRELREFFHLLNNHEGQSIDGGGNGESSFERQEELGQTWFNLLSDLPHCDYLAVSPNGRAYELAPTSKSISGVLWHLLVGQEEPSVRPWTSLHDLVEFWTEQQQDYQQSETLILKYDCLKHQSVDGNSMEHELISLHLQDNSRAIELRLRCDFQKASGMAAVTHLAKPRQQQLIDSKQVLELLELCFFRRSDSRNHHEEQKDRKGKPIAESHHDPSLTMLCLALLSEHESPFPFLPENAKDTPATMPLIGLESLFWLATPYGADRRELKATSNGDPSDCDREVLVQSRFLLRERILHICRICATHPRSGAHLLSWILQESPIVVETSSSSDNVLDWLDDAAIEEALLSLPTSVLDSDSILEAIEWNWTCVRKGRIMTRVIRWKLGKLSTLQVFVKSKFHELAEVASLATSIKGSE